MTETKDPQDGLQKTDEPKASAVRTHYVLASGMGTVAAQDYDPKIHGKVVEETDEQFAARLAKKASGVPKPGGHPPTTIANLQSFDPALVAATAAPVVLPATLSPGVVGQPVVTTGSVDKDGKIVAPGTAVLDKDGKPVAAPVAVAGHHLPGTTGLAPVAPAVDATGKPVEHKPGDPVLGEDGKQKTGADGKPLTH